MQRESLFRTSCGGRCSTNPARWDLRPAPRFPWRGNAGRGYHRGRREDDGPRHGPAERVQVMLSAGSKCWGRAKYRSRTAYPVGNATTRRLGTSMSEWQTHMLPGRKTAEISRSENLVRGLCRFFLGFSGGTGVDGNGSWTISKIGQMTVLKVRCFCITGWDIKIAEMD